MREYTVRAEECRESSMGNKTLTTLCLKPFIVESSLLNQGAPGNKDRNNRCHTKSTSSCWTQKPMKVGFDTQKREDEVIASM